MSFASFIEFICFVSNHQENSELFWLSQACHWDSITVFPGCHVNVTPQKNVPRKPGSLRSLQKWFRWKWLRKRRPEGSKGQGHNLRNLSSKTSLVCCSSNLVFVSEWIYPGYLEDDRGSIATCFVATGCTDLYVTTTVMAGVVILRGFFSRNNYSSKTIPTSHCVGSHVFQPHSEKRSHQAPAKHSELQWGACCDHRGHTGSASTCGLLKYWCESKS